MHRFFMNIVKTHELVDACSWLWNKGAIVSIAELFCPTPWRWLECCVNLGLWVTDPRPGSDQITEFSCSALCDNTVGGGTVFWKPLQPLQWFRLSKLSGRHVSWGQKSLPAEGWLMVEMRDLGSLAEHQKHCVFTRWWLNPLLPAFLPISSFF